MSTINMDRKATSETMKLFNAVMDNTTKVGNKVFAYIPLDLLKIDEYQRINYYSKRKLYELAENFDYNLMDALKVAPHPEEGMFAIVNGFHRGESEIIRGQEKIVCEIIQGLSSDPRERKVQEALLFAGQSERVDKLSPVAIHNALLVAEEKNACELDRIIRKYGFQTKRNDSVGRCPQNTLTGISASRDVIVRYGSEMFEDIIYVLHTARWGNKGKGLSDWAISIVRNVFVYNEAAKENREVIAAILKKYEPKLFEAKARAAYDMRGVNISGSLYLEDMLAEVIKIDKGVHEKYHVDTAA